MSKLETITIDTPSGSNTMQIGSTNTATINLGVSGDTVNIPAGVTIANAGTATGFSSTISTPYAARMYGSSSQSIANSTHVALDFASEVIDKGGIADVSTDRMTVPSGAGGLWWMTAAVQVNNFRAQRNILNFYINGSTTGGVTTGDNFENGKWDDSGHYSTSFASVLFNLSAGDYVTAHFFQNGGSTEQVVNRSFTAWYLGASS